MVDSEDSNAQALELQILVRSDDQLDVEDIDALTRSLSAELEEIPAVNEVKLAPGQQTVPPGSKSSTEVITLGAVLLAILPDTIPAIIDFLKQWALRPGSPPLSLKVTQGDNSIELEYDPQTTSVAEITKLLDTVGLKSKD